MSNTELKPCPFCGGEAKISSYDWGYSVKAYWIYCHSCDCASRRYHSKEEAIDKWNTRKPMDNIVAELECRENFYHNCALGEVLENGHTLDAEGFLSKKNAYSDAIDIIRKGGVE